MTDVQAAMSQWAQARQDLSADCSRCEALCCVAPAFARSADFALDKPARQPCPKLGSDSACTIHSSLRKRGFPGCAVFDCFGAGQQVVQVTLPGQSWRTSAATARDVFDVFEVMRQLKELQWYLAEATARLAPGDALHRDIHGAQERTIALVEAPTEVLRAFDATAYRREVGPLLGRVSEALRAGLPGRGPDRIGADLIGADLAGADLSGISLRGSYLLGANLRVANLRHADLLGADLRGADLSGAHLPDSLFLTQPQLEAASGDGATALPPWLRRPSFWPTGDAPTSGQGSSQSRSRDARRP